MGENLTDILNCPVCNGEFSFKQHSLQTPYESQLTCLSCSFQCPIRHGVADFIGEKAHTDQQIQASSLFQYDDLWASALKGKPWPINLIEKKAINKFVSGYSPKVILDVGSGVGRHIPLLAGTCAEHLICVESSAAIYEVAKKFGDNFIGTMVSYVSGDIETITFKHQSVDLVWAIGILNFFSSQQFVISKFAKISALNVVLGLNSTGFLGRLYTQFNLIRPLLKLPLARKVLMFSTTFLALLIVFVVSFPKLIRTIGDPEHRHFKDLRIKADSLKNSLAEPFVAPRVTRYPDIYYENCFSNLGYVSVGKFTNSFISVLCFKRI